MHNRISRWHIFAVASILAVLQGAEMTAGTRCPSFCRCDKYFGQNRANCSSAHLISANLEMGFSAELLDLSVNGITTLDKGLFKGFPSLMQLNVSHNAIESIYADVFRHLKYLVLVDLSYNRLESIDPRLFESNMWLRTLHLAGNAFRTLPLRLRSNSLRTLDLRNAQIMSVTQLQLDGLPQLRDLDLSQNLMIVLDPFAFLAAPRLQRLDLNANRWSCDRALMAAQAKLQLHSIHVMLQECVEQGSGQQPPAEHQFERMQALPGERVQGDQVPAESEMLPTTEEPWPHSLSEEAEDYDYWLDSMSHDYDMESTDTLDSGDYGIKVCTGTRRSICHNYQTLVDMINRSAANPSYCYGADNVQAALIGGIVLGVTAMLSLLSCALCVKRCADRRTPREAPEHGPPPYRSVIPNSLLSVPQSLPPRVQPPALPVRQSSRRRVPQPPGAAVHAVLMRHDELYAVANRDNFITRLFGRPARHQYIRTTRLIRRLSQSNLFLNRAGRNDRDGVDTTQPERPETPPPKYQDAIATSA